MGRHDEPQPLRPARGRRASYEAPAGRPRPGVVASTGQIAVPRRSAGPTGTAPIPVVLTPPVRTAPPSRLRVAPAPLPRRRRRRRPMRSLLATLAVVGLAGITGIPAFAVLDSSRPAAAVSDGDEQQYSAGSGFGAAGASVDAIGEASQMPVQTVSWVRPVIGTLGDPFGPRPIQPVPGVNLFHRGQDIVAGCGSTIHAAADGTVEYAGWDGTYGNWILISHGGGIETGYAHEEQLLVSVGQHVSAGQTIGLVGETGAATGCHLHLEVHVNGTAINPVPFFTAKGVNLGG